MDQGMEIGGDTMTKRYWEWDPVFSLDPAKSALLVIDMQNGFIEEGAILEVPMARRQVPTVKKLVRYCRDNGIPVVFTRFRITGEEGTHRFYWRLAKQRGLDIASPDFEFLGNAHAVQVTPELAPEPGEHVVDKPGYDCFAESNLDEVLNALKVSQLMFTGTVLNWCVDSTVRAAYHRHYDVAVIADGVSSYDHANAPAEQWCSMELDLMAEAFGRVLTASDAMIELSRAAKGG